MQLGIQFFKTQSPWGWEIIKGDLSIENICKHCLKNMVSVGPTCVCGIFPSIIDMSLV